MNSRKLLTMVLAALLIALILPVAALAQPAVSVECAYNNPTSDDLICQVWVDTTETLRSAGVSVSYNPGILTFVSATRNPAWMLTAPGAPAGGYDYEHWLDTGTAGQVIMVVGYLDTAQPEVGITNRTKVADLAFTRNATPAANNNGAAQAAFFGISAALGRSGDFVNFVNTAGANLDTNPPTFSAIVAERGDANADGSFTNLDMGLVRNLILSGGYLIYADTNGDGMMTNADMGLIRNKIIGM